MKIYATLIVKDNSDLQQLRNAVDSVAPYVSGWYVVANGEQVDEIEKFVTSTGGHYFYKKWGDDFSEQRNFIIAQLPKDCDYYIWLDSDDILVGGEYLVDLANLAKETNKDQLFFEYWYACTFNGKPSQDTLVKVDVSHMRERLLKPGSHYWKGRLHETPLSVLGSRDSYTKVEYRDIPIAVLHTKTKDEGEATMLRNKRILEKQLEEERLKGSGADPRTLLYLMKIYAELSEAKYWKECIKMGKEYLKKSGWDEERAVCCDIMAICHNKLGENQEAIKLLHDAIREYPHYPLLYLRLAMAYLVANKPREAKHWLEIGVQLPISKNTAGINHVQEMKILSAQVLLKLKYSIEKDYKAALEAARILQIEQPCEQNEQQFIFLQDLCDLTEACERTDKLFEYLDSIGAKKAIEAIIKDLPEGITAQPFAIKWLQQVTPPRVWGSKEVCYLANFGGAHFEKWDMDSLQKGIGGSETAVLELAKEWAKRGYDVTIYGDPIKAQTIYPETNTYFGKIYIKPWYTFNIRDKFNIFIQWRSSSLAQRIKCKRFLTDLHDLYAEAQLKVSSSSVDRFMVKSQYHRNLAPSLPDEKFRVISNGIREQ